MGAVALGSGLATIFSAFKACIPEARALLLVHSDGSMVAECVMPRPAFDADALAGEYLPLLQIARRASEDMGTGRVAEHILVTASSIVVATYLPSNHFSIVVTSSAAHLGRLRYEIKRMGDDLEKYLRSGEKGADFRR